MQDVLNQLPVATILVVVFAVVGGIAIATNDLNFEEYLKLMAPFVGLLAVGRGLAAGDVGRRRVDR